MCNCLSNLFKHWLQTNPTSRPGAASRGAVAEGGLAGQWQREGGRDEQGGLALFWAVSRAMARDRHVEDSGLCSVCEPLGTAQVLIPVGGDILYTGVFCSP